MKYGGKGASECATEDRGLRGIALKKRLCDVFVHRDEETPFPLVVLLLHHDGCGEFPHPAGGIPPVLAAQRPEQSLRVDIVIEQQGVGVPRVVRNLIVIALQVCAVHIVQQSAGSVRLHVGGEEQFFCRSTSRAGRARNR